MGRIIHKQKDGLYAIWSTIVDGYVCFDCTEQDVFFEFEDQAVALSKRTTKEALSLKLSPADEDKLEVLRREW